MEYPKENQITRLPLLDVWVDVLNMDNALLKIRTFIQSNERPHCIFAVNPEKALSIPKDPFLHNIFKKADVLIPDGIGVVLAARLLHGVKISRVTGVDLMKEICRMAANEGYGIYIYGATEEVNIRAVERLQKEFPGLSIVGRMHGYVTDQGMMDLIESINASGAQILFLALGSPMQERWFLKHSGYLSTVSLCQGIGGSLDVIAGKVKRAPLFWQKLGMEWLYRLIREPTRIRRQWVLPMFALRVFKTKMMVRHI